MKPGHWFVAVTLVLIAAVVVLWLNFRGETSQIILIELEDGFEIELKSFGDAQISEDDGTISVFGSGREGGVLLRTPNSNTTAKVYGYSFSEPDPIMLRIDSKSGRSYTSSDELAELILGSSTVYSNLLYREELTSFDLNLFSIGSCQDDTIICADDGYVWHRYPYSSDFRELIFRPFGQATAQAGEDGHLKAKRRGGDHEFGIALRAAPTQPEPILLEMNPHGLDDVSVRLDLKDERRYLSVPYRETILSPDEAVLFFSGSIDEFEIQLFGVAPLSKIEETVYNQEDFQELLPAYKPGVSHENLIADLVWATSAADYALDGLTAETMSVSGLDAHEIYFQYFLEDEAGGYCGQIADFFAKTLQLRGHTAFPVDFGVANSDLTHVTTIVADGNGQYYLLDATFGMFLADATTNKPMNVLDALDGASFRFVSINAPDRSFIQVPSPETLAIDIALQGLSDCKNHPTTNTLVCKNPSFGYENYVAGFPMRDNQYGIEGGPGLLLSLMKHRVLRVGTSNGTSQVEFSNALVSRGIPVDLQE